MPTYCRVSRTIAASHIDSWDEDTHPERLPVYGNVTFTPVLAKGDAVTMVEDGQPVTFVPMPVEARISDGVIFHRSEDFIELLAGGEDMQPERLVWRATFSNMQSGGKPFTLRPVVFEAVPDGTVDLTRVAPVAGTPGVGVTRGRDGDTITGFEVAGESLVLRVRSGEGVVSEVPVPLGDVARTVAGGVLDSAESAAGRAEGAAERVDRWASEAEASAGRAEGAAGEAGAAAGRADASAQAASQSASAASGSVDSARAQAEAAAASAGEAEESSSAAGVSAAAAKEDADRAAAQAQSADTAVSQAGEARDAASQSASQAGDSARAAAVSASEASESADRAQRSAEHAGEAATNASVSAVAAKVEELTRDAPEAFDTLAEIAAELEEGTSVRAALTKQIAEKADAEHTHTTADVEGLDAALASKAEKSHSHEMSQITGLSDELAGKAAASHTHTTAQITDSTYGTPLNVAIQQHVISSLPLTDIPVRIQQLEEDMPVIQVVDALPESPKESTIYLVKE